MSLLITAPDDDMAALWAGRSDRLRFLKASLAPTRSWWGRNSPLTIRSAPGIFDAPLLLYLVKAFDLGDPRWGSQMISPPQ